MIGIAALVVGIVLGLVFQPDVPEVIAPYLPIAVVAALDAVFGGLRAYLEHIFDAKVFVVSFVFNVLVAALIVYVGDQLGWAPAVHGDHRRPGHPHLRQRRGPAPQAVRGLMTDHPHGKHELPTRTRSQMVFGVLAVLLCLVLGVAIATQVRQTESGDSLETARPRICWCCWTRCSSARRR